MDFHSLSRRELQALCKNNGIRANMSNAAMVEALQCLPAPAVDRTDEIGWTAPPPPPVSAMKDQTHESLLSRGGRARAKTRMVAAGSTEEDVPEQSGLALQGRQRTAARKDAVPPEAGEAIGEEQEHGCPLPRGGRARGKTRKAAAGSTEEDVPEQASLALQGCQRTAARKAAVPPEVEEAIGEEQEHGCPLPRGGRARGKTRKAGARNTEEEEVAVPGPHTLPGNKRTVAGEAAVAPVDAEEVAVGMRRTRRSARSKVKIALDQKEEDVQAAAARKEHKDKSCDDPEEHVVVVVVEEEVTKPQEGQEVTADEVAMAKKRTRRSTRSKLAAAAQKGQEADSSDTTVGPEVDPKDDEVVPKLEQTTKPHEGKNAIRRIVVCKAQEEVQTGQVKAAPEAMQTGQVKAAPEAMAAVEVEEVATTKRRRGRSARSKVRVAARKGQKADSSDAINGSTVSDDPKEEQVVEVIEEGPNEATEEREQISNVRPFASLPKLEESPILGVASKPNAEDASDKAPVADEEAIKEDGFTFTGEADVSNLLVNTLDRFSKPMYKSIIEEEKKGSECWWMLL